MGCFRRKGTTSALLYTELGRDRGSSVRMEQTARQLIASPKSFSPTIESR